ncbi:hypothetical protein CAV_1535 [Campylobacter avium LMG 24591]|uniref:Uncharacterized protein n=1 Tax=Campylobacter avium LMG 24591 TaxID=522484 RepID=A0A222MYS3_9BACT|nr:hypothetical protein [Campylobacter avium]ASQ31143.1 hypothetical protein CAV_1535 [Campylobacter avium LMG 24591]OYD78527.1 hypothetical protein CAV8706_1532 [Campylobacter avium]
MKKFLSVALFVALSSSFALAVDSAKKIGANAAAGALSGKSSKEIAKDAEKQAKDAAKQKAAEGLNKLLN